MKIWIALAFLMVSSAAQAAVWQTRNNWNSAWEERYQAYVRTWNTDFFARKTLPDGRANPYQGLRTDCADTVYSIRAIFAYENGLPYAINDSTGSGRLITNEMTRFDSVENQNTRFRKFLLFMYDVVSTQTMHLDTFPVAVNADYVRPGTIIKTTKANHHSWTIKNMLSIGVPHLIFNSTIGATSGSMLQDRKSWPNPFWVFEGNHTPAGQAGFRNWRPLAYLKSSVYDVPGYSEEQYNISLSKWNDVATSRLASQKELDADRLMRLADNACVELKARVGAVKEGVDYLRSAGPRCMKYETYDTYSTPSRDERFFDALVELRRSYKNIVRKGNESSLPSDIRAQMAKLFPYVDSSSADEAGRMKQSGLSDASMCTVTYGEGRTIDLAEAKRRMFLGLMSNNPHDGLEYRWGERRGPSSLAASCQSWDKWAPNLGQAD